MAADAENTSQYLAIILCFDLSCLLQAPPNEIYQQPLQPFQVGLTVTRGGAAPLSSSRWADSTNADQHSTAAAQTGSDSGTALNDTGGGVPQRLGAKSEAGMGRITHNACRYSTCWRVWLPVVHDGHERTSFVLCSIRLHIIMAVTESEHASRQAQRVDLEHMQHVVILMV